MKIRRANLSSVGLVVFAFIIAAALYTRLPESVPTHWNAGGEADGFIAKPWGPFILPLTMAGVHALFLAMPRVSPRGFRVERFQSVFEVLQVATLAFLFLVTVLALLAGIGIPVPMDRVVRASAGLLFVVIGNFMGKLTKNFFVGIRTPWTLASDEVWLRTHRLGGKLFVAAGIALFLAGLLGGGTAAVLAAVALAGGIPVVYSYFLYRRIEGFKNGTAGGDAPH
jgi:uncharacterized membrane protein